MIRALGDYVDAATDAARAAELVTTRAFMSMEDALVGLVSTGVKLYRDGVEATSGWAVDTTAGHVTFSIAPAVGVQITVNLAFDVPVRFDSDQMDVTIETYQLGTWGQIPVVEIRP